MYLGENVELEEGQRLQLDIVEKVAAEFPYVADLYG